MRRRSAETRRELNDTSCLTINAIYFEKWIRLFEKAVILKSGDANYKSYKCDMAVCHFIFCKNKFYFFVNICVKLID